MTSSALPYARELGLRAPLVGLQGALVREMPAPGSAPPGPPPPAPPAAGRRGPGRAGLVPRGWPRGAREPPRTDGDPGRRRARGRTTRAGTSGASLLVPDLDGVDPRAGHEGHLGGPAAARRPGPGPSPGRLRRPRRPDRQPPDVPRVPGAGRQQGSRRPVPGPAARGGPARHARDRRPAQRRRDDRRGGHRGGDGRTRPRLSAPWPAGWRRRWSRRARRRSSRSSCSGDGPPDEPPCRGREPSPVAGTSRGRMGQNGRAGPERAGGPPRSRE